MASPTQTSKPQAPVALTIAGSDSGANAGIQADMLAFAANHAYGTSVVTCLTAQNPDGVSTIDPINPQFVAQQAKAVHSYFNVAAAKTGMLFSEEIIEAVAAFFAENPEIKLVIDPVMVASSGKRLLKDSAISTLKSKLLPRSLVVTPNLDEAEILYGGELRSPEAMVIAAAEMAVQWKTNFLLKGGHLEGDDLYDILADKNGVTQIFRQKRIQSIDTHGSGCTLSAAITAQLAQGKSPLDAISIARSYLRRGMENPVHLSGKRFINHFPR